MKIKDILKLKGSQVFSILDDKTLKTAMKKMVVHNIGALLVMDKTKKVVGIISERDIMRVCSQRYDKISEIKVKDVMVKDLIIGFEEDDLEYVESVMTDKRIRHLPIFAKKELVGMISIGDLVKFRLDESHFENRYLKEYILGKFPG